MRKNGINIIDLNVMIGEKQYPTRLVIEIVPNKVISIQKNEPVSKVVTLMKDHGYSQIPVFHGNQSLGSISEKTILRQILDGKDLAEISDVPTEQIM